MFLKLFARNTGKVFENFFKKKSLRFFKNNFEKKSIILGNEVLVFFFKSSIFENEIAENCYREIRSLSLFQSN